MYITRFMRTPVRPPVSSAVFGLVLGVLTLGMSTAQASDDRRAVATIEASAVKQVLQDEVHAIFSTQATGASASAVNRALAAALDNARQGFDVPEGVEVSSGPFNVYLNYGKDKKPDGWVGRASLQMVSTDLDRASVVIERFGRTLAVSSLGFSLSRQARQLHEKQLMTELARDFAERAQAATDAFGFKTYEIIDLDFTGTAGFSPRVAMQRMEAAPQVVPLGPDLSLDPPTTNVNLRVTGEILMLE